MTGSEWWRTAVIYQIYPRSFADSNGDGMGDLAGITSRLPALRDLGIDAIWLSPFYTSPQRDAGYDVADYCDVDPLFGTLDDFATLQATAHDLGIRVIVDLVPNHSSSDHPWFQAALAAGPGSEERGHYIFRDGKGVNGQLPPNNWESVFGGLAWTRVMEADGTPGQWYLHLFDSSQPDFDWQSPWVRAQFRDVLRFWLDRGADGFRVDVAHGMIKAAGLPDYTPPADGGSMGGATALEPGVVAESAATAPYWAQPGVHEIYRDWRLVLDEYPGDRILAAEAWVDPLSHVAEWVRPDEMHQAFNFAYLETLWGGPALRRVIDDSLAAFSAVGAPSTWVLSNHDVVRHASRLALTGDNLQGHGIGPKTVGLPDTVVGLRRARAASALMLALPGSSYLYQGEELGLPEVVDLPDTAREDPTWFRTNGERYGRDGCRVPLPWVGSAPSYGFGPTAASWLPQPAIWGELARDVQEGVPTSTLELYKLALRLRKEHGLGLGSVSWLNGLDGLGDAVVAFTNGSVTVVANTGAASVTLPAGEVLLASEPLTGRTLPGDTTAWLRA
ncbi:MULTISPECIES: glycoside hydrolase family 13 protein [unclassified Cryobacterium]|uniref:glycoside hydrolase family 13 protein n=1 Tax=unclassified Cryobacterium TaxID=2649013 RepID=UPI00106C0D4A|nr:MULTISPECIES: glycoside hydrolase family 13 protein [unclassified Cryobacterium]MDY7529369.1 glycoside hydrolase family 13 protein [Cryobacterium sp. 10C2]MEB0003015.1 glycoside hydrolase family 13 protein [Cryobacterium sp. RTC2.1]MEB0202882.1 glycoside hydrolase family 13 protein [Cryobacterium sp. 5I3]MEB0290189.1 glycoside hydrolase family 13 protein [Cryobacterium sp. 10C2]TFB94375.1 glycoside hydrolase family 13 protein [Cryobacterium sp. MDB2-A-1]